MARDTDRTQHDSAPDASTRGTRGGAVASPPKKVMYRNVTNVTQVIYDEGMVAIQVDPNNTVMLTAEQADKFNGKFAVVAEA